MNYIAILMLLLMKGNNRTPMTEEKQESKAEVFRYSDADIPSAWRTEAEAEKEQVNFPSLSDIN